MVATASSTALVTGASSGIGYELAQVLAQQGHNLVLVARRRDRLEALQSTLQDHHSIQVWVFDYDLSQADTPGQLVADLQAQGITIDMVINNAGFGDYGPFLQGDWATLNAMMQLNMVALTHLTHALVPAMVQRGQGRVMNVASTAAFQPGPLMAVYFATKAYVLSFSEAIAQELLGTGVTVTTLCPGPTTSEFQATSAMEKSKLLAKMTLPSAASVAEFGYKAMMDGQRVAVHGTMNQMTTLLVRFLPRSLLTALVAQAQTPVTSASLRST